jgi:hypothetical protein
MTGDIQRGKRHLDRSDWIALALVLLFTVAGILTLPNYSLTWDEGLGNLFFGERYFHFFTDPRETYVNFKVELPADRQSLDLFSSPLRRTPYEFPPFADTLSAASMAVFAQRLGWMDPVDAFHLPKVLAVGLLLWCVYWFTSRESGKLAGMISLLLLATFPRVWGDMHFNPKDVPETVLFALIIFGYYAWLQRPTWGRALGIGLLFGAALGTKVNAVFIPFVLVLGLWPLKVDVKAWRNYLPLWKRDLLHYFVMGCSALVFYVLSWPYLYVGNNPVRGILKYFQYIAAQGGRTGGSTWSWDPFKQVVFTMPETMLILLGIGIPFVIYNAVRNDPRRTSRLLLVWFLLPIVRTSLPGMVNFDGIRHFLEFVPAAAMIAGTGLAHAFGSIRPSLAFRRTASAVVIAAILGNTILIVKDFWRYEHLYYNGLTGGFAGARLAFGAKEASDYWASSYRQGMAWINEHAEPNAAVYIPVAGFLGQMTGPLWLRGDITTYEEKNVTAFSRVDGPAYIMLLYRPDYWDEFSYNSTNQLRPVYQIMLQGQPILNIYKRH